MTRALPKFLRELDPNLFLSNNYVVLDFETDTTGGHYGNPIIAENGLILACWKRGPDHPRGQDRVCHWGDEFSMANLLRDISEADFFVAHNAKYEFGWLNRSGADLRELIAFDTKLAEYVLLGNLASGDEMMLPRKMDLDTCSLRRGLPQKDPVVDILIKADINPVRIPPTWLQGRCRQDVDTTEAVFLDQRERLARTNRLSVLFTRVLLTPVLASIEAEGMGLDADAVRKTHAEYSEKLQDLSLKMHKMTGGINWKSPQQSAKFIYDVLKFAELQKRGMPVRGKGPSVTKTGKPRENRKADQKTLDKLVATTKEQREFIKLRKEIGKVNAALSKNLDFFLGVVEEKGGVFYGEFNQANTATHRLSSSGMELQFQRFLDKTGKHMLSKKAQFQNMARAFKKLFKSKRVTEDGRPWLIFDPDGSQLEFRVAVEMAGDPQGIIDISNKDWDAHVTSGSAMAQMSYDELYAKYKAGDEAAAEIRQQAKPETFKPLYGGEFGTPAQMRWYAEFKNRYKGIAGMQADWANQVSRKKMLVTPWGMRYYWPRARVNDQGRLNVKTAVYNYPVQALATAEIIPVAMVYFWHRLHMEGLENKVAIINTVHDSVVCEVHPDYVDEVAAVAKRAFTLDVYNYLQVVYQFEFKHVPLGIGMKAGTHWGSGKESAFNIYADGREEQVK
jgi:DNA polymerase-1